MAGKKNNAVVVVITDVTASQSSKIAAEFMKVKQKYAPMGRGTIATGLKSNVGALLQRDTKMIGGK